VLAPQKVLIDLQTIPLEIEVFEPTVQQQNHETSMLSVMKNNHNI
jgi:hypothetical protein